MPPSDASLAAPEPDTPSSEAKGEGLVPTSTFLQELLKRKKAEDRRMSDGPIPNARHARESPGPKAGPSLVDDRLVQSSPTYRDGDGRARSQGRRASAPGWKRSMGARESEEYISSVHKQNFDLKLELFHRRQRVAALEDKVERLSRLEADNAELQDVNEQLLHELEKRDTVIEEAVGMICALEGKIESLKSSTAAPASPRPSAHKTSSSGWTPTSPSSSSLSASMAGQRAVAGLESDIRAGIVRSLGKTGRALDTVADEPVSRRPPPARSQSYLASKGRGSTALRSLFAAGERERQPSSRSRAPSNSDTALTADSMTGGSDDDDDEEVPEMPDSPRLSVLSESSFLSVYGGRILSDRESHQSDAAAVEDEDEPLGPLLPKPTPLETWEDRPISSRIESWMSERPRRALPIAQASTATSRQKQLGSSGDELDDERPTSGRNAKVVRDPAEQRALLPPTAAWPSRKRQRQFDPPSLHGPIFAGGTLPPTPDTLSTVDMDSVNTSSSNVTAKGVSDGSPESTGGRWPQIPVRRPRGVSDLGVSHDADLSRQLARQGLELEPIRIDSLHQVPLRLEAGGAGHVNASRLRSPVVDAQRTLKEVASLQVDVRSAVVTSAPRRDEKPAGQATDSMDRRGRSYADDRGGRSANPSSHQPLVQQPASPASKSIRPSMKQRGVTADVPVSRYASPWKASDDETSEATGGYASESSARRCGPPERAPRPKLKPNVSDSSRRPSFSLGSPKSGGLASRLFGRSSSSSNPAGRRRLSNQDLAASGSFAALTNAPRFLDAIGRSLSANLIPDAVAGNKSAGAAAQPVPGGVESLQQDSQMPNSVGPNNRHNGLVVDGGGRTVTVAMTAREPAQSGGLDVTEVARGRAARPPARTSMANPPIPRRSAQPVHSLSQHLTQINPQSSGPVADLRKLAKAAAQESPDSSRSSEGRSRIRWSLGRSNSAVLP
ncbi:MAG: hypothetical protein M1815_003563 [Lichina confinis]|nr:MAG: hypothetical protein M1815_003563 [Lichina confinis]